VLSVRQPARLAAWVMLAGLLPAFGCSGRLTSHFVSKNTSTIMVEPTDAKVITLHCDQCYWWIDDQGEFKIAGKGEEFSLLGERYQRSFYISFAFDEPSQGIGKNYKANFETVRGLIRRSGSQYRFKSLYGIVGTENRSGERIAGAFRVNVSLQSSSLLGGWSKPSAYLIFGTFNAVHDPQAGARILEVTEADGFDRTDESKPNAIRRLSPATSPVLDEIRERLRQSTTTSPAAEEP